MGALIEKAMTTPFWNDIVVSTNSKFVKKEAIDLIFGSNPELNGKAVSPVLFKMLQNKQRMAGGRDLQLTYRDKMSEYGGWMNPYKGYPAGRTGDLLKQTRWDYGYLTFPMLLYKAEELMNRGSEASINYAREQLYSVYARVGDCMAKSVYSDGTSYYDRASNSLKPWNFINGTIPPCGFGFGNSAVDNACVSTTNNYAGLSRAAVTSLQANVQSAASLGIANPKDVTFAVLHKIWHRTRIGLGAVRPDLCVVGEEMWENLWEQAVAKGLSNNIDGDLFNVGFQNFKLNGQLTIVEDPDYCPADEITMFGTKYFYPVFQQGEEPALSEVVWLKNEGGYKVRYSELAMSLQFICEMPMLFGRIHTIPGLS